MIGCLTETTTCVVAKPLVDINALFSCFADYFRRFNIFLKISSIFVFEKLRNK